eukprot:11227419-Lingulodinium_polyedra.AAC.1
MTKTCFLAGPPPPTLSASGCNSASRPLARTFGLCRSAMAFAFSGMCSSSALMIRRSLAVVKAMMSLNSCAMRG